MDRLLSLITMLSKSQRLCICSSNDLLAIGSHVLSQSGLSNTWVGTKFTLDSLLSCLISTGPLKSQPSPVLIATGPCLSSASFHILHKLP